MMVWGEIDVDVSKQGAEGCEGIRGTSKRFCWEPVTTQIWSCSKRFFMISEEILIPLRSMVCETLTSRTTWEFFASLAKPAKKLKVLTMRVCTKKGHAPIILLAKVLNSEVVRTSANSES